MDMNAVSEAISLATAPVFLLTAVAGFLNALGSRIGRVIDRARSLEALIEDSTDSRRLAPGRIDGYYRELESLALRKRVINAATAMLVFTATAIALTVIELFYAASSEPGRLKLSTWVSVSFVSACAALGVACVLYLIEIVIASRTVTIRRPPLGD